MALKDVIVKRSWQARLLADGLREAESIFIGDNAETKLSAATVAWTKRFALAAAGHNASVNLASGLASTTVPPVAQVESTTIVAAAGATANGNLNLVLTAAGLTGSPLVIPVALTTVTHTSAALIAAACRTALAGNAVVAAMFTIGGAGANITLTRIGNFANDGTLNLAIPGALGVTAAAASANTTAGVFGTVLTNAAAVDARGKATTTTVTDFCEFRVSGGEVTIDLGDSVLPDLGSLRLTDGAAVQPKTPQNAVSIQWESGTPTVDLVYIGH